MSSLVNLQVEAPKLPVLNTRASEVIVVDDKDSYEFAVTMASEMKVRWKEIDAKRVELKAGALKACKDIDAFFKPALSFYEDEEKAIKIKLNAYIAAEREREQKRAEAAAKAAKEEQDELAKQAAAKLKKGDIDGAQAILDQAAVTAPVDVAKAELKVDGGHTRKVWCAELTDAGAFLKAAIEGKHGDLMQFVNVDVTKLKRLIAAGGARDIPGVRVWQEEHAVISTF